MSCTRFTSPGPGLTKRTGTVREKQQNRGNGKHKKNGNRRVRKREVCLKKGNAFDRAHDSLPIYSNFEGHAVSIDGYTIPCFRFACFTCLLTW